MKKQRLLIIFISMIGFLVAANLVMGYENQEVDDESLEDYQKIDYQYVGESNHWVGEYIIEGEEIWYEQDSLKREYWYDDKGILEYKGDKNELKGVKEIKVKVGSSTSSTYAENGILLDIHYPIDFNGVGQQAFSNPEEPFEVTITWDDQTEVIEFALYDTE